VGVAAAQRDVQTRARCVGLPGRPPDVAAHRATPPRAPGEHAQGNTVSVDHLFQSFPCVALNGVLTANFEYTGTSCFCLFIKNL